MILNFIESHPVACGLFVAAAPFVFPRVRRTLFNIIKTCSFIRSGREDILSELSRIRAAVDSVSYQVHSNDGGSLKDSTNRMETSINRLMAGQVRLESYRQHDFWTRPRVGLEMDSTGHVSLVSEAACRLFGVVDPSELKSHSWVRFLDPQRSDDFMRAFCETSESSSLFRFAILLRDSSGNSRGEWEFKANPIDFAEPKLYSGFFAPVDGLAKSIVDASGWLA